MVLYFIIIIFWNHRHICGPSLTETSLCGAYLYLCLAVFAECRSQWPRGLRRRSMAARLLRSWVRIPPRAWMFVCCECCVFSGRGLCDGLIIRSEESYRLWRVVVCDHETSQSRRLKPARGLYNTTRNGGCGAGEKKKSLQNMLIFLLLVCLVTVRDRSAVCICCFDDKTVVTQFLSGSMVIIPNFGIISFPDRLICTI